VDPVAQADQSRVHSLEALADNLFRRVGIHSAVIHSAEW
jgi:hypothetical protein